MFDDIDLKGIVSDGVNWTYLAQLGTNGEL